MLAQGHATPDRRVYAVFLSGSKSRGTTRRPGHALRLCSMGARVSDRIGAIAESATLAVDAKAKALKAAGGR